MFILIAALGVSLAQSYMTLDQIKQSGRSKEKAKPKQLFVPYVPLSDVIPKADQDRLDEEKKKAPKSVPSSLPGKSTGLSSVWRALFPEAYAMGCNRVRPEPEPLPSPTPSAMPSIAPSPDPMPSVAPSPSSAVDLRACDTPIKSQVGPRCTAWGTTSAVENLRCKGGDLSERHVWSWYKQYSSEASVNASVVPGHFATTEAMWPSANDSPWSGYLDPKYTKVRAKHWAYLDADISKVIKELDKKHPVKIAHSVSSDEANCREVIRWDPSVNSDTGGGHDVTVVGYQLDPEFKDGGYLILKNSWGTDCGDAGYQYMSFGYCGRSGSYCLFWALDEIEER